MKNPACWGEKCLRECVPGLLYHIWDFSRPSEGRELGMWSEKINTNGTGLSTDRPWENILGATFKQTLELIRITFMISF